MRRLPAAGAFLVFVVACGGGDAEPTATPTATETATSPVTATATSAPTSIPLPTPTPLRTEVLSTAVLVDVGTGAVTTIFEGREHFAYGAKFEDGRAVLLTGDGERWFTLDGDQVAADPVTPACRQLEDAAEVRERVYDGVRCGMISPDGRWMTYAVDAGTVTLESGGEFPQWDQWLVDLESGETRLIQAGLVHCGGCDGRYAPIWSPSSRFVVYAEFGGDQRRYLTDVPAGTTRPLGTGAEVTLAPVWSPAGDLLVYGSEYGGESVLEDLDEGTSRVLPVAWPVAYDETGTLLYSPAWSQSRKEEGLVTTIIAVEGERKPLMLPGAPPPDFLWTRGRPVAAGPEGVVSALQGADGCDGTAIYLDAELRECVEGGVEGRVGLGRHVAVARLTDQREPGRGMVEYAVDIVTLDGETETVVTGALSFAAPHMLWSDDGTYLLVLWPRSVGL